MKLTRHDRVGIPGEAALAQVVGGHNHGARLVLHSHCLHRCLLRIISLAFATFQN